MNSTLSSRISHVLVFALLGAMSLALSGCADDTTTTTDSGTHDGGTDGDVIADGATGDGGDGTYSL
ncbi:MAG: hypothetical protein KC417_16885, partial [Myxococcales bacterium]|nr:hypothetical protein [Myxococcales bacterium]